MAKAQAYQLTQEGLDFVNIAEEHNVFGESVYARSLSVNGVAELKRYFPEWKSLDPNDLLNELDAEHAMSAY